MLNFKIIDMKSWALIFVLLSFLPTSVLAVNANYLFNQVTVFVDMEKKSEQFYVNLTCLEGEVEYFEIGTLDPIRAYSANDAELRREILPHSTRIYFEKSVSPGESYAFYINIDEVEPKYLEENTLYYKSLSFQKDVEKFNFIVRLPEGIFPDVATHDLVCAENCNCVEGGTCACEYCLRCLGCVTTSWMSTTTLPPNEMSIENNRVTLAWTTSLKANEKFDIGLIYPKKKLDPRLYLAFIAASIATFSVGFVLAWKKKKRAMVHVFLTEEERAIVEFIQSRGGEVYQKDIWKAETLPFSRPKVSRLIADLEDRGIIKRDPYKKTFRVSLVRY
jgi:uncharacterized membrane protein